MEKPYIALDLDGVVVDFYKLLLETYNSRHNPPLKIEQFLSYDFSSLFPEDCVKKIVEIFNEPGFFEKVLPMEGAIDTINQLQAADYRIVICTAPARNLNGITNGLSAAEKFSWVAKQFPRLANEVIVTAQKHFIQTDMLVDDCVSNINRWCRSHPNGVGYLVSQIWNSTPTELPVNSVRAELKHLDDFVRNFWCPTRKVFAYKAGQLTTWRNSVKDSI